MDNEIFLIEEDLPEPSLSIANKLLGRQNLNFDQLTSPEQELWKLFKNREIYKFLSGEKDTVPQFDTTSWPSVLNQKWTLAFKFLKTWIFINKLCPTFSKQYNGPTQHLCPAHAPFVSKNKKSTTEPYT